MLKELYSGKIVPWERQNRDSEEKREIFRQIEAEEKYFAEMLTPEDGERFKNLLYMQKQLTELTDIEVFCNAFSFGALLMIDVCEEAKAMEREEHE